MAAEFELEDDRTLRFPVSSRGFFFELGRAQEVGVDPAELRRVVARAAAETDWIHSAFTHEQLVSDEPTGDDFLRLARNSYTVDRGMDVQIVGQAYLLIGGSTGTSHGSPHPYDRQVPLVFYGPGFEAGMADVPAPVGTECAVPTVLELLGREPAGPLDGRSLRSGSR